MAKRKKSSRGALSIARSVVEAAVGVLITKKSGKRKSSVPKAGWAR